jgi:hypothetical protein
VSDGVMSFTLDAAEEMGLPEVIFWTTSASGYSGYVHFKELIQRGITPLKGNSLKINMFSLKVKDLKIIILFGWIVISHNIIRQFYH